MLQYILGSWDRSYKALNKSEQEDKDAIFREWNRSIRGMWQKSVTELTMLNIQIVGEEQVPIVMYIPTWYI